MINELATAPAQVRKFGTSKPDWSGLKRRGKSNPAIEMFAVPEPERQRDCRAATEW